MSIAIPYLLQGKNIILVVDGKSHTVTKDTHMNYEKIVEALKAKDWDALRDLLEPKKAIINFGKGYVTIDDNGVMWKGHPFHNALSRRMIEMYQDGFPIDPMIQFMERLMKNPSKRSVDQLYGFLEKNNLPITEDGYFLAYKKVREDYKDIHTGTISNHIGAVIDMERNLVDDNPDSTCSSGLHFCSESYLTHFGNSGQPVMILKIDPADVVSIPSDYDGAKGRCSKYEVIAQVNGDPKVAFTKAVDNTYSKPVPQAVWPFATGDVVDSDEYGDDYDEDDCDGDCAGCDCSGTTYVDSDDELYDLRRVHGGWVEYENMTLDEARKQVAKNVSQKKAMLKIYVAGTTKEVS